MIKLLLLVSVLAANKLTFDTLPAPARAAVEKAFGKAKVLSVEAEREDGKVVYEVKVKHEGHVVELKLTPEGTVLAEEREVRLDEAPASVRQAVTAAGGKVESVEQVTEAGVVTWEVTLQKADRSRVELVVQADGGVSSKPATE